MSRNKTQKFSDNRKRQNVVEPGKEIYDRIKGQWRADFFESNGPISLEIACGRGEYTVGLAQVNPQTNYVGVDIKGDRIWAGSRIAEEQGLRNVGFLRTEMQFLDRFFAVDEVDEIWMTFPDPRPKKRDIKRRLAHPRFMDIYQSILQPGGWFRLKTDNTQFFEYTLELINDKAIRVANLEYTYDLYQSHLLAEHHGIRTKYEKIFTEAGEDIKYLKFQFENH